MQPAEVSLTQAVELIEAKRKAAYVGWHKLAFVAAGGFGGLAAGYAAGGIHVEHGIAALSALILTFDLIGTDPESGETVSAKIGRFGPVVQIGSPDPLTTYSRCCIVEMVGAYVDGRPMPSSSSFFTREASVKRGGKGAQEAHEAIRPTYVDRETIDDAGSQEKRLYALIRLLSRSARACFSLPRRPCSSAFTGVPPAGIDLARVDAQQARRVLDRIVGFELSPVLWQRLKPAICGTYRLVCLLCSFRVGMVMPHLHISFAMPAADFAGDCRDGILGEIQRVGTHVGDVSRENHRRHCQRCQRRCVCGHR